MSGTAPAGCGPLATQAPLDAPPRPTAHAAARAKPAAAGSGYALPAGASVLSTAPFWIMPQPIRRQCFSTRRLSATFSPSLVHTGEVSCSLARSPLTCARAPPR